MAASSGGNPFYFTMKVTPWICKTKPDSRISTTENAKVFYEELHSAKYEVEKILQQKIPYFRIITVYPFHNTTNVEVTCSVAKREDFEQFVISDNSGKFKDEFANVCQMCGFSFKFDIDPTKNEFLSLEVELNEKETTRQKEVVAKTEREPCQEKNIGMQSRVTDAVNIHKHFLVSVPSTTSTHVKSVRLACPELKKLDDRHLTRKGAGDIWELHVDVPSEPSYFKYWYVVDIWNKSSVPFVGKLFESMDEFNSKVYSSDDLPYMLDLLSEDKNHFSGFVKMCSYLISDVTVDNLKERIMMLENFQKRYGTFCMENTSSAIKQVLASPYVLSTTEKCIAFTCFIGHIVKDLSKLGSQNCIDINTSQNILSTCCNCNMDRLPTSCRGLVQKVLKELCKIRFGEMYSVLAFIYMTYPFLPLESFPLKEIQKQEAILKGSNENKKMLHSITRLICQKIEDHPLAKSEKDFLDQLQRHLPLELQIVIVDYLLNSHIEKEYVESSVKRLVAMYEMHLKIACKEGNMSDIIANFELLRRKPYIDDDVISSHFEPSFLLCLQKFDDRLSEDCIKSVYRVCKSERVFKSLEMKDKLLAVLIRSRNIDVHFLFIQSLNLGRKFDDVDAKRQEQLAYGWFDAAVEYHCKRNLKDKTVFVKKVYSYLGDLLSVKTLTKTSEFQTHMIEKAYSILHSLDILDTISSIPKIEELPDVEIEDIFKLHVQRHLKESFATGAIDIPDLVMRICGKNLQKIRISSKPSLATWTSLIENTGLRESFKSEEAFLIILDTRVLWIAIFNAEGKKKHDIWNHSLSIYALKVIRSTYDSFLHKKITSAFFEKIRKRFDDCLEVWNVLEKPIKLHTSTWKSLQRCIEGRLQETKQLSSLIHTIKGKLNDPEIKDAMTYCKMMIDEFRDNIANGEIQISDIEKVTFTNTTLQSVFQQSRFVFRLENSIVFWNLMKDYIQIIDKTEDKEEAKVSETDDDDMYISQLFYEDAEENAVEMFSSDETKKLNLVYKIVSRIGEKGGQLYREFWFPLLRGEDKSLCTVYELFFGSDLQFEINNAKNFCSCQMDSEMEISLQKFFGYEDNKRNLDILEKALEAFKIDCHKDKLFHDAKFAYEKLREHKLEELTLRNIREPLAMVERVSSLMSDQVTDILDQVGHASLLIEFLRSVADDDLRNLIDAVEEHSEQYVRESTVSDLINVKRFFQPLLRKDFSSNVSDFLQTVKRSVENSGVRKVSEKIDECVRNLHGLKALYKHVANRGERTKEIVENVVIRGKFRFSLKDDSCDVTVEYKQDKKTSIHGLVSLGDLRSRALLMMNSEDRKTNNEKLLVTTSKKDALEKFVEIVDTALEISTVVVKLKMSGHFKFSKFDSKCSVGEKLLETRNSLVEEYDNWQQLLKISRDEFYLMNFIHGDQLQVLFDYLKNGSNENMVRHIMKFIHPDITEFRIIRQSNSDLDTQNPEMILQSIGRSIHRLCQDLPPIERKFLMTNEYKYPSEVVHFGRPYLVSLDSQSRLVVGTLLALYLNTTGSLPEAHQILFCNSSTSFEEVKLIIRRCIGNLNGNLFCIANVEKLHDDQQFKLASELQQLPKGNYRLAIICKGGEHHPFVDQFSELVMHPRSLTPHQLQECFKSMWPNVCTITSDVPGLGKSDHINWVSRLKGMGTATLHVSGPVKKKGIVQKLLKIKIKPFDLLHIDIGVVNDSFELDEILFELIATGYLSSGTASVFLPTNYVYIEIGNSIGNILRNSMTNVTCFNRQHLEWDDYKSMKISAERCSPVQVVCTYLKSFKENTIDKKDIYFNGPHKTDILSPDECRSLLKLYFSTSADLSYSIVNTFLGVLSDQLKKLSTSLFFRTQNLQELKVKSELMAALIAMSKDFSSRSILSCRSTQTAALISDEMKKIETILTSAEELAQRVHGMIRWEDSNHLMVLFHEDMNTMSALYRMKSAVPFQIKTLFESQLDRKLEEFSLKSQNDLIGILVKLTRPHHKQRLDITSLKKNYALTPDNLLKMVLMYLRMKAHVPVVIMGETGCGKTSLVRYLASVCGTKFEVLSLHAGVREETIVKKIKECDKKARQFSHETTWLFLDEINTCDHLGLLADIICHNKCLGESLAANIVFIGACNPYRLRSVDCIHTAGLQTKIKTDELSRLVYRVHPLPEMMVDFVFDFGTLSDNDEAKYVERMMQDVMQDKYWTQLIVCLITESQQFIRKNDQTCSVSLRDVERCNKLITWFMDVFKTKISVSGGLVFDLKVRSIIMALAVCYQSRFADGGKRKEYRDVIATVFRSDTHYLTTITSGTCIKDIIEKEQDDIIDRMELPQGIAKNTALRENIFVILVCILNKIPVFVVGKPGCSKSLSMQLIRSNLRGKDSKDRFFKTLPQLYCVSFQGSESSTSDGIIKVFDKAKKYQEHNNEEDVMSVVILDEIGLAEISRFNPLKVLHSLLEPENKTCPDVAVVGISNWALDAAKMNRAIHLSRPEMDCDELFETSRSISLSLKKQSRSHGDHMSFLIQRQLSAVCNLSLEEDKLLRGLAEAYFQYSKEQIFKNFHGLRDFYSLTKHISKGLLEAGTNIEEHKVCEIVLRGIRRNLSGLPTEMIKVEKTFIDKMNLKISDSTPVRELIKDSLADKYARHLMLITSGNAVIGVLEAMLKEMQKHYIVILGSQFEDDQTDEYHYRILSRIILCMEQGFCLILKDLENIYGSLYDMLNQNYTTVGQKRNCRVALGPYSNPMCHVHDDFKCIVVVEESKLDLTDPPFLNRFEKQTFRYADMLDRNCTDIIGRLNTFVTESCLTKKQFQPSDTFPLYTEDLIPSLVIAEKMNPEFKENMFGSCCSRLLWISSPDAILRMPKTFIWNKNAMYVRKLQNEYFLLPVHNGLEDLLIYVTEKEDKVSKVLMSPKAKDVGHVAEENYCHGDEIVSKRNDEIAQQEQEEPEEQCVSVCETVEDSNHTFPNKEESNNVSLVAVYTHSNIHTNVHQICNAYSMQSEKLSSFRSEKTLYLKLRDFFDSQKTLLTIQCSSVRDSQHILMAKTMIEEQKQNFEALPGNFFKIVCMIFHIEHDESDIVYVPQMDFLSGWRICMLDTIQKPVKSITSMQEQTVHNILSERRPLHSLISEHLFWAFSRIKYSGSGHSIHRMMKLIENIKSSQNVLRILEDFILEWILNRPDAEEKQNWLVNIACDKRRLLNGGSFNRTIETYLSDMIKVPLAMVFFRLEEANALDSLFVNDSRSSERFITWSALLKNKDLVNIEDTHEPSGPECYTCESPLLTAKLPFSYIIIQRTEKHKDEYLETVSRLKIACEIEDEELPSSIFVDLLTKYKDIIHIDVAEISSLAYTDSEEDYTSDFWKYISMNHCKSIKDVDKIQILKWLSTFFIETTNDELIERIAKLHLTHWTYGSTLLNVLTLFELLQLFKETSASEFIEMVQNVILQKQNGLGNVDEDKEQLQNEDSQSLMEQNTEMYKECIVESICEILLPTESTMKELGSVKKWQTTANCILPYLGSLSLNPNWIHCLRFCSDLACNLFIRFDIQEGPFVVIGELLGTKGGILDESEICATVYSLLYRLRVEKPEIKIQLQKVLTIYVHRCLAANENSNILHLVIDCIGKDKFIDFDCAFMGPIFSYAFDIEESENEDFLVEILESTNEYVQCHPLLQSIDCSLKLLQEKGVPEPPLASLFVEVMQRKFNDIVNESNVSKFDSTSSTHAHLLTSAVDIVKSSSTLSVRVVAAIALIRQFIVSVVSLLRRTGFNTTSYLILMQQLDAVFTPKIDADELNKHRTQCLVIYFLKSIREIEGTLSCQKRCTTLMKSMPSLKDYVLSSTALSEAPFFNPFQSQIVEYGTIEKSLLEMEEKKNESLQRFLSDARMDRNKLLCLFNLFAEKIFFRNIIEQVPDTVRDVAKKVLSMASSVNFISTHLNAMRFLSLESDFCHKMFAVNTESETHVVQIVSVLVHLMCNILTFGKTGNIWYDWLSDEKAIVDRRLPGLTYTEKNITYPGSPFLCICGIRFISCDNMCPQCGSEQKSDNLGNATSSISAPTLSWFSNELHFQIGYFFARGVQICSYALGVCMDPECAVLGTEIGADTDMHDFLQEEISATWSQLKKNLQMSDEDLSSFFRLVVLKFQDIKFHDESIFSCKYASDDIYKVEKEMDKVLKELIPKRFKEIALFHRKFYQMIKDNNRGLLTQLDESVLIDTVHEKQLLLPSLFKVSGVPSFQGLLTEVRMCKTGHPFLSMVLRDMELLNLPQYILPLLQWHKVSVAIGSFKVRRVECSEITVGKFISMEPVVSRRRLLKRSFEEFAAAWQKSRKCFELIKDQLNSQYMDLPLIANNTKLENCLMINENSTFEAVLNLLVQIQNEFLDRCLSLACKEECTCLQFLHSPSAVGSSKILSVPLNEATPGDIIVFEWDDDMLNFSQCNTNEGSGKQILYDLEKIEREVAHSIVQGKRFLKCSIGTCKIIFIDELFQNSAQLLHDIKQIIPQEPLKSDTIKAVLTKKEEDNTFIEALLTQVGMVLSIMKKVGGDATESLVDYLERWKDIMSPKSYMNLLPEPRSSIKLCHVVALFQYLEELSGDSILESLDDRYRSDLPIEGKMMLENIGNAHLKHIGKLGQSLKIFLHRSMTFSERAIKLEQPLSDYLMDPKLWPEGSFLGESIVAEEKGKMIQMPLRDVVHITVLVEHIYGTISYIQEFIEIQKQQDQRISSVVASFKSHSKEQKQNQKSKVAKKRFGKT